MADLDPGVDICKHGGHHYLLLYSLHNDKNLLIKAPNVLQYMYMTFTFYFLWQHVYLTYYMNDFVYFRWQIVCINILVFQALHLNIFFPNYCIFLNHITIISVHFLSHYSIIVMS